MFAIMGSEENLYLGFYNYSGQKESGNFLGSEK